MRYLTCALMGLAIVGATVVGADLLRKGDELGRIAPGYRADLIAVDGSPHQDIEALHHVAFVMVDGRVVKRDGVAVFE